MSSYCLDVELFISEVQKFPVIWDLNCEDNRYKCKKQQAWSEIARVFINDFDDMPELEKLDVYRKLHGKWRNIRDSYARHVKRRYGRKGYMYAKHLSFLNTLYKRNSQSGSDADDNNDESWQSDGDETKLDKLSFLKNKLEIKSDPNWPSDPDDSPSTIENLKRKRKSNSKKEHNIEYVETSLPEPTCSYSAEDEDRSFFESLLPAVRGFDVDQKLEFRSEVLRLIKEIRCNTRMKFKLDPSTGDYDE